MPEDAAPGFDLLSELINSLPDNRGNPTMPTLPQGSPLGELLDGLFGNRDPGGPGEVPTVPQGPSLGDLLANLFDNLDPAGPVETPKGPNDPTFDDLISDFLNNNQGNFRVAQDAGQDDPPPEWEGNVPPDLTDGFDFLL